MFGRPDGGQPVRAVLAVRIQRRLLLRADQLRLGQREPLAGTVGSPSLARGAGLGEESAPWNGADS